VLQNLLIWRSGSDVKNLNVQLLDGVADYQPGQQLRVEEMFKEGDLIDVAGTSVGKGFQGDQRHMLKSVLSNC
jgi:large subunit ribosomal protein L3